MTLRRTFLSLLLILGVSAAMVTAASMATFSDQVVSQSNEITAGTLYLTVDDCARGSVSDACETSFQLKNVQKPGDSESATLKVVNSGSVAGDLSAKAELSNNSCFSVKVSPTNGSLAGGANTDVTVTVSMPSDAGNECQAAKTDVTVTFDLEQS